ncbi:permease [Youngiibacter fragilis]|uniref:Permease n=1 Tax=Youngiibacter fragilis 232.1 TaxID=994573 RepID=V7I1Q7_9CLOT|nr:permease [Youngiibacter fragilis]ETA79099.1 permease [Youngiibacter fragilis 232.1]
MEKGKKFFKRYKIFLILAALNLVIGIISPEIGLKSLSLTKSNVLEMLSIIPPVFVLLGLLDVWVKRETMVKYMGKGSGLVGVLIAFFIGSAAAGPLYAAFPVAGVLLRKGSSVTNVYIMLGAWSTTKIPLLLFEASSMGLKFTGIRLCMSIIGITIIALMMEKFLPQEEKDEMVRRAMEKA